MQTYTPVSGSCRSISTGFYPSWFRSVGSEAQRGFKSWWVKNVDKFRSGKVFTIDAHAMQIER